MEVFLRALGNIPSLQQARFAGNPTVPMLYPREILFFPAAGDSPRGISQLVLAGTAIEAELSARLSRVLEMLNALRNMRRNLRYWESDWDRY